jgi:formate hydrogenlyase subunit 3/multisubunit Na+/H+ antiporter MnhD subunit
MFPSLRILEHIHGHIGWLATIVLVHPALVLRRRGRRADWAIAFAALFPTVVGGLGAFLYGPYREQLKPAIFQRAPEIGLMFERKEHLAFATIALAWMGAAAYFGSWRVQGMARERLHALSHRTFVVAAILAIAVASIGTWVASYRTF